MLHNGWQNVNVNIKRKQFMTINILNTEIHVENVVMKQELMIYLENSSMT